MCQQLTSVFLLAIFVCACATASDQEKFLPIESTTDQAEVLAFLALYNQEYNSAIRHTPLLLRFTTLNAETQSFSALFCEKPSACTAEEMNQGESEYLLQKADVNNDTVTEYVLITVGQGSDLNDVVLGVYQQSDTKLIDIPFDTTIIDSLGEKALKDWPARISQPFITKHKGEYYLNFENPLVWRDKNGKVLTNSQLNNADTGTIEHFRYLWKGGNIQQVAKYTQSIKRQDGP
jgi:hypothetical protein